MRWIVPVIAVFAVVATAAAMPFVIDDTPQSGAMLWPEMMPPDAPEALLSQMDPDAPAPTPNGLKAALDGPIEEIDGDVGMTVYDGLSGETIYESHGSEAMIPASSLKVATGVAALREVGATHRIPTRVVQGDNGQVTIVGGGDVTLSADGTGYYKNAASLADLAEQVKKSLDGEQVTSVTVDTSLFDGDKLAPGVPKSDVAEGYTSYMEPLMMHGGRLKPDAVQYSAREEKPALEAAKAFAHHLGVDDVSEGTAPEDAETLGTVYSPPIQQLVEHALLTSDNTLTDSLSRQVAIAAGEPASFEGGVKATQATLKELGVSLDGAVMNDGSGLSPDDRLSSATLADLIKVSMDEKNADLSSLFTALPVAGFTGSLHDRYIADNDAGAGKVHAKTGTLSKVSSLTGYTLTQDGRVLVFALIANKVKDGDIETDLDAVAATLAQCGCR